jgi:hypothetical protein
MQTRRQALYLAIGLAAAPLILATRPVLADDDDERRRREAEDREQHEREEHEHRDDDRDREHHDKDDHDAKCPPGFDGSTGRCYPNSNAK